MALCIKLHLHSILSSCYKGDTVSVPGLSIKGIHLSCCGVSHMVCHLQIFHSICGLSNKICVPGSPHKSPFGYIDLLPRVWESAFVNPYSLTVRIHFPGTRILWYGQLQPALFEPYHHTSSPSKLSINLQLLCPHCRTESPHLLALRTFKFQLAIRVGSNPVFLNPWFSSPPDSNLYLTCNHFELFSRISNNITSKESCGSILKEKVWLENWLGIWLAITYILEKFPKGPYTNHVAIFSEFLPPPP